MPTADQMPDNAALLNSADWSILAAGTVVVLGTSIALTMGGGWRSQFRLPSPRPNTLEPTDIAFGICAFLAMSSLFYSVLLAFEPSATSQSASQPVDDSVRSPISAIASTLGQTCTAAVLLFLGRLRFGGRLADWGLTLHAPLKNLLRATAIYIAFWPACFCLLYLSEAAMVWINHDNALPEHPSIVTLRSDETPAWVLALTVLCTVGLAPIVEELMFRGLLLPALARWSGSQWKAILATGLLFGLIHLAVPQSVPALALFGVVLGYAYMKTQSLTLVILIHAVFNAKTVIRLLV